MQSFFRACLRRVCAGRRVKTGVFRSKHPRFWAKPPIFPSWLPNFPFEAPHFSCAAGECAVCSEERCAVSRPPREGGAEAARQLGRRARRSGGGVKNMPGGVVDRWWDSASERRQNDVFSGCDEKNVAGLQKKCTENCCGGDFTNIIFRKSLRRRIIF